MFDMGIPRVKVVNPTESWRGTECYIDENKVKGVKSVDFRVAIDEVPQFTFETLGLPDIDMLGDVKFSFTPETVQQAVVVLRNELLKRGVLYDSFLASMRSVIDDDFWNTRETCGNELDIGEDDFNKAAELMLKRIIGLEDKRHGKGIVRHMQEVHGFYDKEARSNPQGGRKGNRVSREICNL